MLSVKLRTQAEVMRDIAARTRERRLANNLTQEGLSLRCAVSLGSIKRFEKTGQISLQSLLNIALALGCLEEFDLLFESQTRRKSLLAEPNEPKKRSRGRIK